MAHGTAAIYTRVSSDEQIDGYSLDAQERQARAYVAANGLTIYDVYRDEGLSGRKDTNRPELQRLKRDIRLGHVKVVIIHKLDRLARNAQLTFNLLGEWTPLGVTLISLTEQMDFSTPMGRVILATLASFAEFFSLNLGLEVKKGLTEKAKQGGWIGPVPLGYTKQDGALIPSDDAPAVQHIFELYATGQHSYTSIADDLNRLGYQTRDWRTGSRGLFGRESVRTILRNRAYAGFTQASGIAYPGNHLPLISTETWAACEQIRGVRRAKEGAYSVKMPRVGGLLTEICFCAVCGARMWYQWSGREGYYKGTYYTCAGRSRRTCTAKLVRGDVVEADAINLLRAYTLPADWRDDIVARASALVAPTEAPPTIDRATIETQLKRLGRVYVDGAISDDDYERQRGYLLGRLAELEQPTAAPPDLEAAADVLSSLDRVLDAATSQEQRALLRCVFDRLWVVGREIKAITPTAAYAVLVGVTEGGVADGSWSPKFRYPKPLPRHWSQFNTPYRPIAYQ